MKFNLLSSSLSFLSALPICARHQKQKQPDISTKSVVVKSENKRNARERMNGVFIEKRRCFLFRFFLCRHKNKNTDKSLTFSEAQSSCLHFQKVQKSAHNSPPTVVLQKCSEPQKKNFKLFSSLLFLYSSFLRKQHNEQK